MKLQQTFVHRISQAAAAAVLAGAAAFAGAQTAAAPQVQAAWARPTVQGQDAGGGFLRIVGGAQADKLVSASAGIAGRVELHSMSMEGDVMRMRQVDGIEVPAGKAVELKPGGLHLMFMDLKSPLKTGASFPLTLRFEKAGEVKVEVKVQPAAPAGAAAAGEHKH
jgi:copper(I)-binding protein